MAESLENLVRTEMIAPAEVARLTPNYRTSEFQGGGVQLGLAPALPAVSSEELKYKNLAAIAGGVQQSIDTFADIAQRIDKETIDTVQARFNEIDAEEIDPREKLKQFTQIVDSSKTILASSAWENSIKAEAKKRFGPKALNEYAIDKFKQDASQDPDFGGSIEDEEFLARFLPKWQVDNPTLSSTVPIQSLDGTLKTKARSRDRELFIINLTVGYKDELSISPEIAQGLKEGSVSITDPNNGLTPRYADLFRKAMTGDKYPDFIALANASILEDLKSFPEAEKLPPQQLEVITKGILLEVNEQFKDIWRLAQDIRIQQDTDTKTAVYNATVDRAITTPTLENFNSLLLSPKGGLIPANPTNASNFAIALGSARWAELNRNNSDFVTMNRKQQDQMWKAKVAEDIAGSWPEAWNKILPVQRAIEIAIGNSFTKDGSGQARTINLDAPINVATTVNEVIERQRTIITTSTEPPNALEAFGSALRDLTQTYTGDKQAIDSELIKGLQTLLVDPVTNEKGEVVGFSIPGDLSNERLEKWKKTYPELHDKLLKLGFPVTRETIDLLRQGYEKLNTEYQQTVARVSKTKNDAGNVDVDHFSATSIRSEVLGHPEQAIASYGKAKNGEPIAPEDANRIQMLEILSAEWSSSIDVATVMGITSRSPVDMEKLQKENPTLHAGVVKFNSMPFNEAFKILNTALDYDDPLYKVSEEFQRIKNETYSYNSGTDTYVEYMRSTNGFQPNEIYKQVEALQAKINGLDPKTQNREIKSTKRQLNSLLSVWDFHVRQLASVSLSTENEQLNGIVKDVLSRLSESSLDQMIENNQHAQVSMVFVAARALADSPVTLNVTGSAQQNDYKYLRQIGKILKATPGLTDPKTLAREPREILNRLFKAYGSNDTGSVMGRLPPRLLEAMKPRPGQALSRDDISGFIISSTVQTQDPKGDTATRIFASFVSGDWELMKKDRDEVLANMREFLSKLQPEMGGVTPLITHPDTFSYGGKTGNQALLQLTLDTMRERFSGSGGLEKFFRMATALQFADESRTLSREQYQAGIGILLGSMEPSSRGISYRVERDKVTGQPNITLQTTLGTNFNPNLGVAPLVRRLSIGDGSFGPGLPGLVKFGSFRGAEGQQVEDSEFPDKQFSYSTINGVKTTFNPYDNTRQTKSVEEINDTYVEMFQSEGSAPSPSMKLIDRVTAEETLLISVLSLPSTPENIAAAVRMFNIPAMHINISAVEEHQRSRKQQSVFDFLNQQKAPYSDKSVLATNVLGYFAPHVELKQNRTGQPNQPVFVIQPHGSLWSRDPDEINRSKAIVLSDDLNRLLVRPSFLNDPSSEAAQFHRARMQTIMIQLAEYQKAFDLDPNFMVSPKPTNNESTTNPNEEETEE
jgi:hypothetical protein